MKFLNHRSVSVHRSPAASRLTRALLRAKLAEIARTDEARAISAVVEYVRRQISENGGGGASSWSSGSI